MAKRFIVTGGAGFIGSAVVRELAARSHSVLVVDKLTYAGSLENLASIKNRYEFVRGDICDGQLMRETFAAFRPDAVLHLAAESHVDRSIDGPADFIQTNVFGTFSLLQAALAYWRTLEEERAVDFRFLHISTDEVFGSLSEGGLFTEDTPYQPNSPYSASKASSDHLVRAWHHTYGLPTMISNCSNNYGPYHFPEKLIPLTILKILNRAAIPVYGTGANVRDWLYVDDHARALLLIATKGEPGECYNVGGSNERTNLDVVFAICDLMNEMVPSAEIGNYRKLITFVRDRPGHDLRYAIDAAKIKRGLGWVPTETFESGLRKTVRWYLDNREWWQRIHSGAYRGERIGVVA